MNKDRLTVKYLRRCLTRLRVLRSLSGVPSIVLLSVILPEESLLQQKSNLKKIDAKCSRY
jgi:hypothetical protein